MVELRERPKHSGQHGNPRMLELGFLHPFKRGQILSVADVLQRLSRLVCMPMAEPKAFARQNGSNPASPGTLTMNSLYLGGSRNLDSEDMEAANTRFWKLCCPAV